MPPSTEARLLGLVADLHALVVGLGLTEAAARRAVERARPHAAPHVPRPAGRALLASLQPTAVLLDVDESVLGLPWELMRSAARRAGPRRPVRAGRHDDDRAARPGATRSTDDPTVKILAVVNPTDDLAATEAELAVLRDLAGGGAGVPVELDVLEGAAATRRGSPPPCAGRDHDIVHFAGHARFDGGDPHDSSLLLADGELTADGTSPAGVGGAAVPRRSTAPASRRGPRRAAALVATGGRANGLPAAFLAAGCEAYVGHFWPVGDAAAAASSPAAFYETLFRDVDAGAAVLDARRAVRPRLRRRRRPGRFGAVFFGDAGIGRGRPQTWPRRSDMTSAPLVLTGTVVTFDDDQPRRPRRRRLHRRRRHDRRRPAAPAAAAGRLRRGRPGRHRRRHHPGLIDLHNHLAYNFLPLWSAPRDTPYTSRHQWPSAATYGRDISNPAQAIGIAAAAAALRYAEVKAAAGGVTAIQGSPPLTRAFPGWMVRNIEKEQFAARGDEQLDLPGGDQGRRRRS